MSPRPSRYLTVLVLAGLGLTAGCGKQPRVVIGDLRGTGDFAKSTAIAAPGAFRVEYSWDCGAQISRGEQSAKGFGYTLFHAEDETIAAETPTVSDTGDKGKGSVTYSRLGNYYFSVNSACDWRIKVVDLSKSPPSPTATSTP